MQEALAIAGIAAGVALLFASQIASKSLHSSVAQLSQGIVGSATLEIMARDSHGFPEAMLSRVRQIPGVRRAAPVLEAPANAVGPRGSVSIELVGADPSLSKLGGALVRNLALIPFGEIGAVVLPVPLARAVGVTKFGDEVTIQVAGRTTEAPLYAQLHERQIGQLISTPVAITQLSYAQQMTGLTSRLSRILVQPARGAQASVRAALQRLAHGHLNVEPTDHDARLFAKAAAASDQSTSLFSTVSALVGFLFAFNAILLTVPQRQRLIADLRREGYSPVTVSTVLLLDAMALGVCACVLGLALGDELSIHLFHSNPAFLSLAFALGSQRVVGLQSIAIAIAGGMLAAVVAVLSPLRDVFGGDPLAALGQRDDVHASGSARLSVMCALAGLGCIAAATAWLILSPDAGVPAMVLLVAALLLELPMTLTLTLALVGLIARSIISPIPHMASMELSAARSRAVAITATGAVAVFGSVAIQGAHHDLLVGLDHAARDMNAYADVWVSPTGDYNLLQTAPFPPEQIAKLRRVPGVQAVRPYRSALLDYGNRRVLVIAPPSGAAPLLPADQILTGSVRQATERVRSGGWLVISRTLAEEHHLRIGQSLTLTAPDPKTFRVAALSTNLGWAPGAIIMNAADYTGTWGSRDVSAYSILLAPGVSPAAGVRAVERAIGRNSGLSVQSARAHADRQRSLSREALSSLTQIATLIPIVAVLAMAAAMAAMLWQRRLRLAKLKVEGLSRLELWRTILFESLILVSVGCLTGATFGLYGQQLADRALAHVINFPVVYSVTLPSALKSIMLVSVTALAILAIPGYFAASVPAALALQD